MLPRIESPSQVALFFDFDGTLVELAPTPDAVEVNADIKNLITQLYNATDGSLAIITGRELASLDKLLELPWIPASGSHGAEWRYRDGQLHSSEKNLLLPVALIDKCQQFANSNNLIFESKGFSIAIHFRNKPEFEPELIHFLEMELNTHKALCIQEGKFVKEIKPTTINKGLAVERFMQAAPFAGKQAWYFGDDVTDEAAFSWVNSNQGISIKVGNGETRAKFRLASPAEVQSYFGHLPESGETR